MASIKKRVNKTCIVWRVIIRRKGIKHLHLTFNDYKDAKKWVIENEPQFIKDPDRYHAEIERNRLYNFRNRNIDI